MKHLSKAALLAAGASMVSTPRRVVASPRADVSDPKVLLAQIQTSFAEFRAAQDARLNTIEAKVDPLDVQKIEAMVTTVLDLQAALDVQAKQIAANRLGGGDLTPFADPEYSTKFSAWFRDGTGEAEIKAAQKVGIRAALSEGSSANGGYTTPVEWDRSITDALKLVSPMRQEAQIQPISTIGFSRVYNDRSVGSGWVGETASRPATSTPGLTSLVWTIGEIYANAAASQDLLDDSLINIADWLTGEIEYEFARQEGIAFLSGDGTNKPSGLLTFVTGGTNAATHPFGAITATASGAVGAYTTDALVSLIYSLPAMYQPNAKFYANRGSMSALMKLKNGQGNYIWQPSFQAGQPSTLMAAPIVDMPDMPTVSTGNASILYGDMRRTYLIVDRMGVRILRDPYTNKPYVQHYVTKRVGGSVQNPQAMKAIVVG